MEKKSWRNKLEVLKGGQGAASDEKRLMELTWFGETIARSLQNEGDPFLKSERDIHIFARAYAAGYLSGADGDVPMQELEKAHPERD